MGDCLKNFKLTAGMRSYVIQQIQQMDLSEARRLDIKPWSTQRGLSSNNLAQVWYSQIGDLTGYDSKTAHQLCKIDFGLSIILQKVDYGETVAFILDSTNFYNQDREHQVKIIGGLQITSKMTTKEMTKYLNDVKHFYGNCGLELDSE